MMGTLVVKGLISLISKCQQGETYKILNFFFYINEFYNGLTKNTVTSYLKPGKVTRKKRTEKLTTKNENKNENYNIL